MTDEGAGGRGRGRMFRSALKSEEFGSPVRRESPLGGRAARTLCVVIVLAVLAASAALLVLPPKIYSRTMVWDLLFNLSGAWAIFNGLSFHTDVHDPLGGGSFWLTVLGFRLVGVSLWAFLAGKIAMSATVFALATVVTLRRLSPVPAALFILMVSQLCLLPTNTGDLLDDFTFAMPYNLYGWSIVSVLALALFLPPAERGRGHWWDVAVVACLLALLFCLKITYYLAGLGICVAAFVVNPSVLARWRSWAVAMLATTAVLMGPWNWPYLADIASAIGSGAVRSRILELLVMFSANAFELAIYLAVLLVAIALWRAKWVSFHLILATLALYGASVAILSQNAQLRGLTLCSVAFFLLYGHLNRKRSSRDFPLSYLLAALMILPGILCVNTTLSLGLYARRGFSDFDTHTVETSALKGLSVPIEMVPAWHALSARSGDYSWRSRTRSVHGDPPVTQLQYVQTILEAVGLLQRDGREPGGVAVIDQVNPLPFALGWAPPVGGNLWYDLGFPWPSADVALANVRYVLVPKFPTSVEISKEALHRFGTYLERHYRLELESESWQLLLRR